MGIPVGHNSMPSSEIISVARSLAQTSSSILDGGLDLISTKVASIRIKMNGNKNDWWCDTCKFKVFGSKLKCLKCGTSRPAKVSKPVELKPPPEYWKPGDDDPKWNERGPYSSLKGGLYGERLEGEPEGLQYPKCGCDHLQHCPKRHHEVKCNCYTCRGKAHKW